MGKLITILGGCVVAAAGVSYGLYSYTSCGGSPGLCGKDVVVSDCCPVDSGDSCSPAGGSAVSADSCPLASAGASCCPSSKAAALVKAEVNCCEDAASCESGLAAVAGAAAFAGKK